ncbi:MAG: MqnA/MqnD/SBP family protein [Limisphaera sp.]
MQETVLTLGHSPDPDDAFMFYGLARGFIPTPGLQFQHVLQDIQTLNERALRGELDISAISFAAYPAVCYHYALLPSGASMGDGYGPLVVARRPYGRSDLLRLRLAVPGTLTSAFLALQLWLDRPAAELDYVVVPFDRIFEALADGQADAGLLIHEGQLTYGQGGWQVCVDLGRWWSETQEGLPLPLGGNVIHKRHPEPLRRRVARVLTESIQYSLAHRPEALEYALAFGRGLDRELADRFVGMYVNHWTLDYGERGRESDSPLTATGTPARIPPPGPGSGVCDECLTLRSSRNPGLLVFRKRPNPGHKPAGTPKARTRPGPQSRQPGFGLHLPKARTPARG